jgi:U3 small nucleolar RNA-associated protein 5
MSRKSTGATFTKTSPSTAQASASSNSSTAKSSILKSAFAPSSYQLRLFASVIQSFESQQLRIHDTNNGRLRCQHNIKPNTQVTCLAWGQYSPSRSHSHQRKKKPVNSQDTVVAYGTSDSEICLFSPTEAKVLGQLTGGHDGGIRDFKFSNHKRNEAWSLGGDGKLLQWNLKTSQVER